MTLTSNLEWHTAAKAYLERLGRAEYEHQKKRATSKRVFRYNPTDYHRSLIDCLNRNDEAGFKALKMLQGYSSALGL